MTETRIVTVTLNGNPAREITVEIDGLLSGSEVRAVQHKILMAHRRKMHQIVYAAKAEESEFTVVNI